MTGPTWQKNFRSIPSAIEHKLNKIGEDDLRVACVKKIPESHIVDGIYEHLGLVIGSEGVQFPKEIIPSKNNGKYSTINIVGKENVRKDLPMITKTFTNESPNFGDWSKGSHTNYINREVYLREYISPKLQTISIELLERCNTGDKYYIFSFTVNEILNKKNSTFEYSLFHALNLLQENIGAVTIVPSDANMSDYLQTLNLNWEILPPGDSERNISRIVSGMHIKNIDVIKAIEERYSYLDKLKPIAFINGTSGFMRYFGAKFAEDLVVFENMNYGNAIYVMYENWEELSKRSRTELLSSDSLKFDRVIHDNNWKKKLKALVEGRLKGKF